MSSSAPRTPRASGILMRLFRCRRGTTAVEFGMVAGPFLMFALGVMGVGLHFFTSNSLDNAVAMATRQIRTGQAQKSGMTLGQFRQSVCDAGGSYIKCDNHLKVHVQSADRWSDITPRSCLTNGGLTEPPGGSSDPLSSQSGGAEQVVLVTLCYEWELAKYLPFLEVGDMNGGSAVMQAVTTFRTEPYPQAAN
ncbi:MAG: TadE/TadG family type IV pilus assembly protein [Rhodospirillaceae bacterium]|nr:TadE/TadG family type IV pilus assembly protein [Rhodospirillaceae bacterium]